MPVHVFSMAMILLVFIAALSGNALLILLIKVDSSLHTPIYFFLSQLAFMDIFQTLIVVPKMAADFLTAYNPLSPAGCGPQIFLSLTMGGAECLLLAVLASYDRYIAICKPLQYPLLLSKIVCLGLTGGVWIGICTDALILTASAIHLPYCGSKEINYFFCEVQALLKLSCSDTSQYETLLFMCSSVMILIPAATILASYARILAAVLRMNSARQQKALATCSSHLTVVGMFYGAATFMYMRPSSYHSAVQDKIVALFYTTVTPVLNPLIYSLRNRDVLGALRKLTGKCRGFQQN